MADNGLVDMLRAELSALRAKYQPSARSPLAPEKFPLLPVVEGMTFGAAAAGIKYSERDDVMLAIAQPGSTIAGVFTTSSTRSANVIDCQKKLQKGTDPQKPIAVFVNSGNSNAFTGKAGDESVAAICQAISAKTDVPSKQVYTASTGVIGERLPNNKIVQSVDELVNAQSASGLEAAARAIMTTDTFAKGASATAEIDKKTVTISGFAKGSGMIAPDMATMLVYIFTDAAIAQDTLQDMLSEFTGPTFNSITVDGDTSTSDSLMLVATGAAGHKPITSAKGARAKGFCEALQGVMLDLAKQVVRDGEGATKLIEVQVTGASSQEDAKKVALSIANSPLVKTAIAGEDPNWGRVVMAVGKSGAKADRDRLSIFFGDVLVAENGWVAKSYTEDKGATYMRRDELVIKTDLGLGKHEATVWTCDLTHQYISINADYRS